MRERPKFGAEGVSYRFCHSIMKLSGKRIAFGQFSGKRKHTEGAILLV